MKRYNKGKDIAVKILNVRNPFNDTRENFIYDGIDAQGNKYTFSSSQKIGYKNYICLSLFKRARANNSCSFIMRKIGGNEMTDAKKVSILEQILDERDEQIKTLRYENAKLKAELDAYSDRNIQNDIDELRDIIAETRKLNREYDTIANENRVIGKKYRMEMRKVMRKM